MYFLFILNFLLFSLLFNLNLIFFNEEFVIFFCMLILFFLLFLNLKTFFNFTFFFKIESIYFLFVYLLLLNIEIVNKVLNLVILQNLRFNTHIISELNLHFLKFIFKFFSYNKLFNLQLLFNNVLYLNNNLFDSSLLFYSNSFDNTLLTYIFFLKDLKLYISSKVYMIYLLYFYKSSLNLTITNLTKPIFINNLNLYNSSVLTRSLKA